MNSNRYFLRVTAAVFISISAFIPPSHAQESTKVLSLRDAIAAALSNNSSISLAKLDEQIAASNYKQTEAIFLPQVGVSYTAMGTNDPLNAFGFKLQQRSITQSDFNPDLLNHPSATADYLAKLEVQQPLLNMDMLYQRKGAQKQTEVYRYKTQRSKEYLSFEVTKAYLQLQLAYNAIQVLEDALQTAQSVFSFTDNHFKQGLIQKSDLLNAQVHVVTVETNLAKAKSNISNASDYLSLLMGEKGHIIYQTGLAFDESGANADTLQTVAATRSDLMAMQKAIEASGMMIKASQMSYLPKLNAFGNYQYNDNRFAGFGANAYLVGIQLSWDIFKGNRTQNAITTQKLERDKLSAQLTQQKDQSQLELSKALRELSDAGFEISQDKAALGQAAESLRILKNRYQQGLVNTTDILMAETQLSQQQFTLAQTQFTLNVTRAYIQLLTTSTK